ncbi:uncharacterized protein LOC117338221 [Pecten maximus]|uniref:uncharacterized protein LOC117338221 n=1 Tax=Pecten maximus TaxID=6579 RepID=UPI00145874DB|nr:uncharacterized protein LOC117338221 [Pecten maximus]
MSPDKLTLDEVPGYQSRLADLVCRTTDGITKIKGYVEDINDDIATMTGQVNKSVIDNVQLMSDLAKKLVPSMKHGSKSAQKRNEEIARKLQENAKLVEQQQRLALVLESIKCVCVKVRSQKGLDDIDIKALQGNIDNYGKTLENEKERKERQEKLKEAAKEKERKEEKRKDPDSWDPLILKDGSGGDRFTQTDVLCVVYAMEGSFTSLNCANMEGQIKMYDWLDIHHEEQASCPILTKCTKDDAVKLEMPMEVYVPYSINGTKHEPEIKVSIDNGPWTTPDILTKRKVDVFPKGIKYVGTKVASFKSFRMIVAAVPMRKKLFVDRKGLKIAEDCLNIQVPADYGNDNIKISVSDDNGTQMGCPNFLGAQVHVDLDCGHKTTKDINVNISEEKLSSHYKERKAVYTALNQMVTSGTDLSNFQLDLFLEQLLKEDVVTTKEVNDNKNQQDIHKRTQHLLEMLLQRPSMANKVLVCLDKSGNSHISKQIRQLIPAKSRNSAAEENWRSVMAFREDGGKWKVLDPKVTKKLRKELKCTLQAGNRRFEMISLTVSDSSSEKDIEDIADQFINHELGTTVTLVCRHKSDDYQAETFVHVLPSRQASKEISRLQEQGYTRGPMELADFNIMDGETVEIYMSGNIGLEYLGRRLRQGTVEKFKYKAHKDICKVNYNIYVVDKKSLDQMDDDRYRGFLHYRVRAMEPLKERTDAVEVTWMKMTKRYLSHLSVNGDLQALGKFISSNIAGRKEMHSVFVTMDTPATVKEIEQRVERQCKNDPDVIKYETTLFIWANQNKDENDKKIERILHAVQSYPWCEKARRFVTLYTKAGLFSEMSLLSMSKLLGPEWKDLAIVLKLPEAQVDYIKSMDLSEQDAKGKMLDKFRLSHYAIGIGDRLPGVFLESLRQCSCNQELLAYVESKMK